MTVLVPLAGYARLHICMHIIIHVGPPKGSLEVLQSLSDSSMGNPRGVMCHVDQFLFEGWKVWNDQSTILIVESINSSEPGFEWHWMLGVCCFDFI